MQLTAKMLLLLWNICCMWSTKHKDVATISMFLLTHRHNNPRASMLIALTQLNQKRQDFHVIFWKSDPSWAQLSSVSPFILKLLWKYWQIYQWWWSSRENQVACRGRRTLARPWHHYVQSCTADFAGVWSVKVMSTQIWKRLCKHFLEAKTCE